MLPLNKIYSINKLRYGCLLHVEQMFEVLEEFERLRKRTQFLTNDNWDKVCKLYDDLGDEYRALLLLGILLHDIGKFVQWVGHAKIGSETLKFLLKTIEIKKIDVAYDFKLKNKIEGFDSDIFLTLLVEHHELLGNFFTGEQSFLGLEPIILALENGPIEKFLDVLILLTVAEVGSQDDEGVLYNSRIKRYFLAKNTVMEWFKQKNNKSKIFLRKYLINKSKETECIERLVGLSHSSTQEIDKRKSHYKKSIKKALYIVIPNKINRISFYNAFARIKKLAYVLRWFEEISGDLQSNGNGKSIEDLKDIIRILWILTRPLANGSGKEILEIRFPEKVNDITCNNLKNNLKDIKNNKNIAAINFQYLKNIFIWKPIKGMKVKVTPNKDNEYIYECEFPAPQTPNYKKV